MQTDPLKQPILSDVGQKQQSSFYLKHLFDPILWNVIVNDQSLRQQRRMSLGADQKVKVQTILVVT